MPNTLNAIALRDQPNGTALDLSRQGLVANGRIEQRQGTLHDQCGELNIATMDQPWRELVEMGADIALLQ